MQVFYSSKWICSISKKSTLIIFQLFISIALLAQTVTVDLNKQAQLIRGFGGINHPTWYSDLNAAERELAFGNGPGQLGLTVLRTYVSDKSSEWGLGLQTAQSAINHGAYVFASPWNPPAGMTVTVNGVKRINPNSFGAYAEHLNSYVSYMKNNGVDLYAISTQNEPDYAHDWTEWSPQESVNFIKGHADKIKCRLMTPESFQYRKNVYDPILNDAAALAKISIVGTHLYGTQYKDFPYPLFKQKGAGKELWMTEVYTDSKYDANLWNDGILNQDQHALKVAEHIHYAMVEGEFQTYVFWPLRRYYALIHDGNSDGNGNSPASAGTATKRGYCMAQFSKWVRPGFVRVDATKSPTTNVFVSAYKKDNDVVFVIVNKNTSSKTITINIPNSKVTTWEQYTTSASKNIAKGNNINGSTSFQVTLDASSVTTFVGKGNSNEPTVLLTSPTENERFTAPATISLAATATAANGSVTKVEFFNGTTKFGEDASAPFTYSWTNVAIGSYTITAKVTDSNGKTSSSSPITIKVSVPQGPYNGTWHAIPGTIQLEHFDVGGNDVAYMDSSPGSEVTPIVNFRTDEDVDIENCTDVDGGYNLGYTMAGEWLEYSVDVEKAGTYDLDLRVASNGADKTVSLAMEGKSIANNIAIPNTEGWQAWQTITVKDINLKAGKQVLRLTIGAVDYVNLNYITFTLTKELKKEPFGGVASSVPGRIEAEHYDLGGEGLAYHEADTNGNQGLATYRNDEVDIEETQDVNGGYNIAYIMAGEWLEYTVNVASDGTYGLDLRVAVEGDGRTLHIQMDGNDITGTVAIPNTGGWQVWETVTVKGLNLTAGEHVMRIAFESDYMNLNYVEFRDVLTGVDEVAKFEIHISPNPFSETTTVNVLGNFEYQIINEQGVILESGIGTNQTSFGQNLSKGVYILKITNQGDSHNLKFIKY